MSILNFLAGPSMAELAFRSIYDLYKSNTGDTKASPEEKAETVETANSLVDIQAKAQQELAIARRILIAECVEITEVYEASGNGGVGVKYENSALHGGAHGEGRKMTQRTIKFTGFNQKIEEVISLLDESYKINHKDDEPNPSQQAHTPS
jgi:hypothetical protein